MCEGDDYWTDEYKLQKQVDYMEENPECTFCFHNAHLIECGKGMTGKLVIPWMSENIDYYKNESKKYSSGELQLLGFVPTASYLFPKYVLDNPPDWYFKAPAGDNAIKLIASNFGYAYYMDEPMCIYRFKVPNSATTKWKEESREETISRCDQFIYMLDSFNEYSEFKYGEEIKLSKLTWEASKLSLLGDVESLRDEKFKRYLELLHGSDKLKHYIMFYNPTGYEFLKKIKKILK